MRQRGLFVTFEGVDGLGKSTNLKYFFQLLLSHGIETEVSREPGGTPIGERIRSILVDKSLGSLEFNAELLLILAARAQHISLKILPALQSGKWFLCDRFCHATYAYQGAGRGLDTMKIKSIESALNITLEPDYTFLFDADPRIGLSRASDRGAPDRFESEHIEFYDRIRRGYRELADQQPEKWCLVDATQSIPVIQEILAQQFSKLLKAWHSNHS